MYQSPGAQVSKWLLYRRCQEEMIQLEYHHFSITAQLMDLGNDQQWLLTLQTRGTATNYVLFREGRAQHNLEISLQCESIWSSPWNCQQGIQGTEEHNKWLVGVWLAKPRWRMTLQNKPLGVLNRQVSQERKGGRNEWIEEGRGSL